MISHHTERIEPPAGRLLSWERLTSESGVTLIHLAITMLVLMGFSAFVIDGGVIMLSRVQAQNAADAGALAGATARAFDEPANPPSANGAAYQSANTVTTASTVFGNAASPNIFWTCPAFLDPATNRCATVEVYRDGTHGSAVLPKYFSAIFGSATIGIRATATARVADANHTNCLKPFMIPDKYTDVNGNGKYDMGDIYNPPGYTLMDVGTVLTLHAGNPQQAVSPSQYYSIGDANEYEENIVNCQLDGSPGDTVWVLPGLHQGPTNHALSDLLADGPVVLAIAFFSPIEWEASRQHGTFPLHIYNIMGFCVRPEDQQGAGVTGKICTLPGELDPGAPAAPNNSTFLKVIELVQ